MAVIFRTRIYVPRREKPDLWNFAILSVLLGGIIYLLWPESWYAAPFLVLGAGLGNFQRFYLDSGKQKRYGYLGRYFTIEKEGLRINGVLYHIQEISDLTVSVLNYEGEERITAYAFSLEAGVNNTVAFKYREQTLTFTFYLNSEHHQADLWDALHTLQDVYGVHVKAICKGKTVRITDII